MKLGSYVQVQKKHRIIPSCKIFFKPLWSTIAQEDDEDEFLFFKKAIPGLFSFIFIFSRVNSKSVFCLKFYWWLASNRRPLASEVTALPTEPQPLPQRRVSQLLPSQLLLQPFHQETVRMWWNGGVRRGDRSYLVTAEWGPTRSRRTITATAAAMIILKW